jgi:hypothetical protein
MISKRVEAGEEVDVIELFRSNALHIEELKDQVDQGRDTALFSEPEPGRRIPCRDPA